MNNSDLHNQEQFLRLLMLNDKSIYAYILSLVHNVSDADDIWQETSAVMWRKFSDFKPDMDFVSWGMTVARYQVLSFFKKRKSSKITFNDQLIVLIEEQIQKSAPEIEEHLAALKGCVSKLNDRQRNFLKMRYEKSYSIKNIGAYFSKSTSAVFYTLSKIHKLLAECVRNTLGKEVI